MEFVMDEKPNTINSDSWRNYPELTSIFVDAEQNIIDILDSITDTDKLKYLVSCIGTDKNVANLIVQLTDPTLDPYWHDANVNPKHLGAAIMLNPFPQHTSAQRLTMMSTHITQHQIIFGCEMPKVFTGFEKQVGEYERDIPTRKNDVLVLAVIPRYSNVFDFSNNKSPYYSIVTKDLVTGEIDAFELSRYTHCSEGYGYMNRWLNVENIAPNTIISKEDKLVTSPAHTDFRYCQGVNLKVAYMSIGQVTEDALVVSKSTAKKLASMGIGSAVIKIDADQIPLNLYGDDTNYKFFPDIGETVRDDGVLCAIRKPTAESIIFDTYEPNTRRINLHDIIINAPVGAEILNVEVIVNSRKKDSLSSRYFDQLNKYIAASNFYHNKIWKAYLEYCKRPNVKASQHFNNLVYTSLGKLLLNGESIDGSIFSRNRTPVTPTCKKEPIEFIYINITYRYTHTLQRGFKLTGRYGNKGTISSIWDDEDMPRDELGNVADIIVDPNAVFNRMNPSQWFEQFYNFSAETVRRKITEEIRSGIMSYDEAYNLSIQFISDIHKKWGDCVASVHTTDSQKRELVDNIIKEGFFLQITAFQNTNMVDNITKIVNKYGIRETPVTYTTTNIAGERVRVTTKKPVMIGYVYFYLLYKMPSQRGVGIGYTNQFYTPVRGKTSAPVGCTPVRLGEDEIRNLTMAIGSEDVARMLGIYANSKTAVEELGSRLLNDNDPSKIEAIELSTADIISSNSMVRVLKHIASTMGINISPSNEELNRLITKGGFCNMVDNNSNNDDVNEDEEDEEKRGDIDE